MIQLGIELLLINHPSPPAGGEGFAKLVICGDSSFSLRMTLTHFEFLIRRAI